MKNPILKKIIPFFKYAVILYLSVNMIALAIPKLVLILFKFSHNLTFGYFAKYFIPELISNSEQYPDNLINYITVKSMSYV